ncbi:MAG: hypothetical protein QNJ31_07060 [Candidatus Caenarcaniphilales bacterium]|nr:hypothetical protein [Candidatus Caenarcaniphilales bacterium]
MKNKYLGSLVLGGGLLMLGLSPSFGAGITGYTGNVESTNAGVASGAGNSASASVQLDVNVDDMMAIGVYDTSGVSASGIFSTPSDDFTSSSALMSGSVTYQIPAETDLNSKFLLDGTSSVSDMQTILAAMNATSNTTNRIFFIKGATFCNFYVAGNVTLSGDVNSVTMTGGTGTAPKINFTLAVEEPGSSPFYTASPVTGLTYSANMVSSSGYSRFVVMGDLDESTIDLITKGNWSGSVTLTLTRL